MKTNLFSKIGKEDPIKSTRVIAEKIYKKSVIFATTVEGPSTQELNEKFKKIHNYDRTMSAYPNIMTDVFITTGNLENKKVVGTGTISSELPKILLLVIVFDLTESVCLSLSSGWFSVCLKAVKASLLHKSVINGNQ